MKTFKGHFKKLHKIQSERNFRIKKVFRLSHGKG